MDSPNGEGDASKAPKNRQRGTRKAKEKHSEAKIEKEAKAHKRETKKRADELLAFFHLEEKRDEPIDRLSGGMKRRLVVARALINRPELLVLNSAVDEHFGAGLARSDFTDWNWRLIESAVLRD